jgi:hypothetical protein
MQKFKYFSEIFFSYRIKYMVTVKWMNTDLPIRNPQYHLLGRNPTIMLVSGSFLFFASEQLPTSSLALPENQTLPPSVSSQNFHFTFAKSPAFAALCIVDLKS